MNEGTMMQISAFVDGELPENESELLLRRMSQDLELRQQAAEYFAIGRALRGQSNVVGFGELRGRISAALNDQAIDEDFAYIEPVAGRFTRPLVGFAIAATVAIAAIFGLQQMTEAPGVDGNSAAPSVAEEVNSESYTVPELEYFQRHNQFSLESGNNNFDARLVSVRMREDGTLETDLEEIDPPNDPEADVGDGETAERQSP